MEAGQSLISELEDAIQSGSKDKRVDSLRRITDLFVADANRLNDQQIDVFDDVLCHLIKRIEGKALEELSRRLAPINQAPSDVVRRLAGNDDIAVAAPILTQSTRLTDSDLIEIASTKPQPHLLAISGRAQIGATVTDVLLHRGDRDVFHKLAGNSGASFSENGFATLVKHSERDEKLAEKVGLRLDVPLRLFRELLMRATEAVRSRLMALAGPESREQIQRVNEAAIFEFAKAGRYADFVAALALLCGAPLPLIESLMQKESREAILVPCKAAGLAWPTVRMIMSCRSVGGAASEHDVESARTDYFKLSQTNAQRVLRFWQVRQAAADNAAAPIVASPSLSPGLKERPKA
jgi:uncharacterized protein (DUF2336 family)